MESDSSTIRPHVIPLNPLNLNLPHEPIPRPPAASMRAFPLFLVFAASLAPAHGLDNGLELSPAMGYSSWNDCASEVTEARIRQVTKNFIDTGLAAKGFVHINIDEGWLLERNATTGALVEDRVKFPSGMKALGEWVHDQEVPGKGKGSGFVQAGGAPPRGCSCANLMTWACA